ncbi:uncharacterized protein MEPE_05610 [Melanopsichium pennsylvanicum]|uniref:Uncharacterized protein n=1 Tax=Melanopsichium pennsylvanicum TaxID=63383 RepID=A0AAJ4XS61_9BASI|nr:uncharacterized protein MEPE_05610 [Melanopsichium pennsylvanicum]
MARRRMVLRKSGECCFQDSSHCPEDKHCQGREGMHCMSQDQGSAGTAASPQELLEVSGVPDTNQEGKNNINGGVHTTNAAENALQFPPLSQKDLAAPPQVSQKQRCKCCHQQGCNKLCQGCQHNVKPVESCYRAQNIKLDKTLLQGVLHQTR